MSSTTLPDLELQPGVPEGFMSVTLPHTNLDLDELFTHRRVAIQKKGGTLTVSGAYLWDVALILEGGSGENEGPVNWADHSTVAVRMNKTCPIFYGIQQKCVMTQKALCACLSLRVSKSVL